ncbi:DNA N-6-adenine-methyltransferase [Bradyrhizobium embrapense]
MSWSPLRCRRTWGASDHMSREFGDQLHGIVGELFREREERRGHQGMGSHQSAVMLKDEWLTPPEILARLGEFDLDPCSPIVRPWETAKLHYSIVDNGLLKPWLGRVWLNPPYGGPSIVGPWMRRMVEHGAGLVLIFARTETELFFETVWDAAHAVLFLSGRLHFHHVDGTRAKANAGAPSVLIAYGEADAKILRDCGIPGKFISLRGF